MLNNYYILNEIVTYLYGELYEHTIIDCFSQNKNELVITFSYNNENKSLIFNIGKNDSGLFLKSKFSKAKKNIATLLTSQIGNKINKISIDSNDRLIYFDMTNGDRLIFCFAPGKENLIISLDNKIQESFKSSSSLVNKEVKDYLIAKPSKPIPSNTIKDYLKSNYIKFGNQYFNEILFRTNLAPADILTSEISERINKEFDSL